MSRRAQAESLMAHSIMPSVAMLWGAGYWGGEKVYRYGSEFQTVLDYFTDSLWDEAPEEYK